MKWGSDGSRTGDRSEIRPNALARALRVVSQRSTPHDRSEVKTKRPAQGAEPHLATITPRSRPCFHGHVDALGVRPRSETHGVDLIKEASAWRAVPDPGRTPAVARRVRWWVHPAESTPARVVVAGLAALPDPVLARAAVPDAGARPSRTRPSPPGGHATIRWSRSSAAGMTTGELPRSAPGVLVLRSGRQGEHLAERLPHRWLSNPARAVPVARNARHAHSRSGGDSTGGRERTCRANLRPADARAPGNRANPANSRPGDKPPSCAGTSKACMAVA